MCPAGRGKWARSRALKQTYFQQAGAQCENYVQLLVDEPWLTMDADGITIVNLRPVTKRMPLQFILDCSPQETGNVEPRSASHLPTV